MEKACEQYGITSRTFYRWLGDKDRLVAFTGFDERSLKENPLCEEHLSLQTLQLQQEVENHTTDLLDVQSSGNEYDNLPVLSSLPFAKGPSMPNGSVSIGGFHSDKAALRRLPSRKAGVMSLSASQCRKEVHKSPKKEGNIEESDSTTQNLAVTMPSTFQAGPLHTSEKPSKDVRMYMGEANSNTKKYDQEPDTQNNMGPKDLSLDLDIEDRVTPVPDHMDDEGIEGHQGNNKDDTTNYHAQVDFLIDGSGNVQTENLLSQDECKGDGHEMVQSADCNMPAFESMVSKGDIEKHRIEIIWGPIKVSLVWYDGTSSNEVEKAICRRFHLLPETRWFLVDKDMDSVLVSAQLSNERYTLVVTD